MVDSRLLCVEDDLWVLEICTDNIGVGSKRLSAVILGLNPNSTFVGGRIFFKNAVIPFWMV